MSETLAARTVERLARGEVEREALARAGDPEPERAERAFRRAASDPDLSGQLERWVPALLVAAQPGAGAERLADLAEAVRAAGGRLDLAASSGLAPLLGASPFLARCLGRQPEWLDAVAGDPPPAPGAEAPPADWAEIRHAKYRGLLRIACRDLLGRPFADGLHELSDLADGCLDAALRAASAEQEGPPPSLLSLGKLGGRELNFSSDVDLLFLYEPPKGCDLHRVHAAVSRVVQRLKEGLETPSAAGFGYRVDLELRPEGRSGVLANPVDAALSYYESYGAEWERQMLLRLRPVAGPREPACRFADGIVPFVYRRSIDPSVLEGVRAMKGRIEEERRRAGDDIERDLKNGPGGIRDVEFLVQSLQLFHGGRQPELRTGNVLDALRALVAARHLEEATFEALRDAYVWLRRAEHALQLAEERQTAAFPAAAGEQRALSRRMGYREASADEARQHLLDDWNAVRLQVRAHYDALVLREAR